jgi:hypothetical protein
MCGVSIARHKCAMKTGHSWCEFCCKTRSTPVATQIPFKIRRLWSHLYISVMYVEQALFQLKIGSHDTITSCLMTLYHYVQALNLQIAGDSTVAAFSRATHTVYKITGSFATCTITQLPLPLPSTVTALSKLTATSYASPNILLPTRLLLSSCFSPHPRNTHLECRMRASKQH